MSKWLGKRLQSASESINKSTDKTEFEPAFQELEKEIDSTKMVVEKLVLQVPLFLHPNPAARTKLGLSTQVAKMRKTAAEKRYAHTYGELGDILVKGAEMLSDDSSLGGSMRETGEALNQMNESRHALDAEVNQNLLDPLQGLLKKELAEVMKQRKKLTGRRLDYDYKRRQMQKGNTKIVESDLNIAESKMMDTKGVTERGMINLLDSDIEQVACLAAFVESMLNMHRVDVDILEGLHASLQDKLASAGSRPKRELSTGGGGAYPDSSDDEAPMQRASSTDQGGGADEGPMARALYDFEAEQEGELSFGEGAMIVLHDRLDENWLQGEVDGQVGIFPSSFVEVLREP